MDKKLRVRPKSVVFLGLAIGLCLAPVEELAPAFVAVEVGGDAWGCGGYKDIPDPRCLDPTPTATASRTAGTHARTTPTRNAKSWLSAATRTTAAYR